MTGSALTPGIVLAAIFLPPLALFLAEGVSRNFWISFGLTCLAYLPGIAFTFYILLSRRRTAPNLA
jgi:uncharacterized membrane protein YqaE (UPF0057 family)